MSISVNQPNQPVQTTPLNTPTATGTLGGSSVSQTATSESQAKSADKCSSSSQSIITNQGETTVTEPQVDVTVTTTTNNKQANQTSKNTASCSNPILNPTANKNENIQKSDAESGDESGYETDNEKNVHISYSEPGNSPEVGATSISSGTRANQTTSEKGLNNTDIHNTRGLGEKGEAALKELSNLSFSRSAGPGVTQGPGGPLDLTLPAYNPTSKESILQFLANSSVQGRLHCKGNHIVFVDHDRGSFIFIENGDFSKARSIIVQDGKTKNPVTNPQDLEMLVAKFCVGFNTMKADWQSRIEPMVEGKAGIPGDFTHLHLSLKFNMAAVYGPRNSKESGDNYTPSIWRRGHQVNAGPIFDDVGPLERVIVGKGGNNDDGVSFTTETSEPAAQTGKTESAGSGGGAPVVHVNVTVGGTNVNVGGTNVTVNNNGNGEGTKTDYSSGDVSEGIEGKNEGANSTGVTESSDGIENDNDIEETDSGYGSDEDVSDTDDTDETESSPLVPTPPTIAVEITKIQHAQSSDSPNFKDILTAVRKHLDVVYPESNGGEPIKVNQSLGEVIKAVEAGLTPDPTKPESGSPTRINPESAPTPSVSPAPLAKVAARVVTSSAPQTSLAFSGPMYDNQMGLEELLKRTRAQTDKAFDRDGNYVGKNPQMLRKIVDAFREETGSGGIIGIKQQAKILRGNDQKNALFAAAKNVADAISNMLDQATPTTPSSEATNLARPNHPLYQAAQDLSNKMQSMLGEATTSTATSTPLAPPQTTQDLVSEPTSNLPSAAKELSLAMQDLLGDITNTSSPVQEGNPLVDAARQLSSSMVTLLSTATAETATSSPVSGEKTEAKPLENNFLQACKGVTDSLGDLTSIITTSTSPTPSKSPQPAINNITSLAKDLQTLNTSSMASPAA